MHSDARLFSSQEEEPPPERGLPRWIQQQRASRAITERWQEKLATLDQPALLISPDGTLRRQKVAQLLRQRDQSVIALDE